MSNVHLQLYRICLIIHNTATLLDTYCVLALGTADSSVLEHHCYLYCFFESVRIKDVMQIRDQVMVCFTEYDFRIIDGNYLIIEHSMTCSVREICRYPEYRNSKSEKLT